MHRRREILFFIVLAGVLVRVAHFYFFAGGPYFGNHAFDSLNYFEDAVKIANGDWLGGHDAYFRAPLYTYWLALIFRIFGTGSLVPIALQWVMGIVGALLIYRLTLRLTRGLPGGPEAALVATAFALFYGLQVHYETQLLDVTVQCFFGPWTVLAGIKAFRTGRGRDFILFGFIGALSCLARPAALPFFGLVTLAAPWLLTPKRRRNAASEAGEKGKTSFIALVRRAVWPVVALWVGLLAPISVVTARNYAVSHSFVPIATYAGINLWIGNNHEADGVSIDLQSTYRRQGYFYKDAVQYYSENEAKRLTGRAMNGAQVQDFWSRRTLREMANYPGHTLYLMAKKFVVFWNGFEIANNKNIYVVVEYNPVLRVLHAIFSFRVFGPLALFGLFQWLRLRRPGRDGAIYLLYVFTLMAGVVGFFVNMRYRYPAVVMMLPLAGFGATQLASLVRGWSSFPRRGLAAGVLAAAILFVNVPIPGLKRPMDKWVHYWAAANDFRALGRYDEAIALYNRVIALDPERLSPYNNLGELYYAQGRDAEALAMFQTVLEKSDDPIAVCLALNNIGVVNERQGRPEKAEACYRRAIEVDSKYLKAWINLGDLNAARGQWEEAQTDYEHGSGPPQNPLLEGWLGQARCLAHAGDHARAQDLVRRAAAINPLAVTSYVKNHPDLQPYLPAQTP